MIGVFVVDNAVEKMSFDQAFKRLEDVVLELENQDLALEKNLDLYSLGVELCSKCRRELDNAKLKVEYVKSSKSEV